MANKKITPIKIRSVDIGVYSKLANRAKSKLNRVRKNYGIDLSDEIKIPNLENIKTRKQFNEVIEKLTSFTNRNNLNYQFRKNEYGVVASKAELNKIARDIKKEQRVHDKLAERFVKNNEQAEQRKYFMQNPSEVGFNRPKDFNFNSIRSRRSLERRWEKAKERGDEKNFDKRLQTMKDNYIMMLQRSFNTDADSVVEKLINMPSDDFYELYLKEFQDFDFNEFYITEMEGEDHTLPLREMERHIDRYFQGQVNLDLKGF